VLLEDMVVLRTGFFLIAFLAATERSAQAYVDPGAGSMLIQVLIVAFVGALFQLRRLGNFFRFKGRGR